MSDKRKVRSFVSNKLNHATLCVLEQAIYCDSFVTVSFPLIRAFKNDRVSAMIAAFLIEEMYSRETYMLKYSNIELSKKFGIPAPKFSRHKNFIKKLGVFDIEGDNYKINLDKLRELIRENGEKGEQK